MNKRHFFIGALSVISLLTTAFTSTYTQQSDSYDPWIDTNDDGIIDVNDLSTLASVYGTSGEPINKTEVLLELQAGVDSLNASLSELQENLTNLENQVNTTEGRVNILEASFLSLTHWVETLDAELTTLQAYVNSLDTRLTALEGNVTLLETDIAKLTIDISAIEARVAVLEATIIDIVSRVEALENQSGFTYAPAYDSGWIDITNMCGQYFNVTHNLNTTNVLVDITGKQTLESGEHQRNLGGTCYTPGWSRTYLDGWEIDDPWVFSYMVQSSDRGYAMAGWLYHSGDCLLVKTDEGGNVEWSRTYGTGWADSIVEATYWMGGVKAAGGYALAGCMHADFWLLRTDEDGTELWNKTYGGPAYDRANSVIQTNDLGYALAGYTTNSTINPDYDFFLVKTSSWGNEEWNRTYGGIERDEAYCVVQTDDGGYAIAGNTGEYPNSDFWLVKTNSTGHMEWNQTYGGADNDRACSVVQTSDGGYAIAGTTDPDGVDHNVIYLVKTDSSGNMEWNKTYGGAYGVWARSMVQTDDGGYAIAGSTQWDLEPFCQDLFVVKTGPYGNVQWSKTYDWGDGDWAVSVVQMRDGGYAIAGQGSVEADPGIPVLVRIGVESGLAWTDSTNNTINLYRGRTDPYWNLVRVRIWRIKETP